jgi:thiol:disulfide interchange protein
MNGKKGSVELSARRRRAMMLMVLLAALLSLPSCGEQAGREAPPERVRASADTRAPAGREVRWHSSLTEGMMLAKAEKKPLMVDFFSDRCGWCKVLDQRTYSDPEVRKCAERFVSVKLDVGKDPAPAHQYRITGCPTILFMDGDGKVLHSVIGFRPAAPFLAEMQKALAKAASAK